MENRPTGLGFLASELPYLLADFQYGLSCGIFFRLFRLAKSCYQAESLSL